MTGDNDDFKRHHLLAKLNTRGFSMLCALILICSGAYMCFLDLKAKGAIDVKAAFIEGSIETGSLGLLAMFLGVVVVLSLNLNKPHKGQDIRIVMEGKEISASGLSYRKLRELLAIAAAKGQRIDIQKITDDSGDPD